jgi:hypothetical protein
MMDMETFRAGLGRLYRGFDRKPPSEEKVDSLYQHLKKFHSYAWEKAVESLICESTFPSFADIRLECAEWSRRTGTDAQKVDLPSEEECCTPAEMSFWQTTISMSLSGRSPREVAEFAATGLDDPMLVRAHPQIREALAKWARMGDTWAPWDQPEQSDHLRTIPKARDMGYESGVLQPLRSSYQSEGAGEDWFKRNAHKVRSMQKDHAVDASFAEVIDERRALPPASVPTRLVGPPAV